jgi:hypothetical protein
MVDPIHVLISLLHAIIWTVYRFLNMSSEALITIILTALAVMLAVLGLLFVLVTVVLAFLAIFGYKDLARMITENATNEVLKRVPTEQALKAEMQARISTIFKGLAAPVIVQADAGAKLVVGTSNPTGQVGVESGLSEEPEESPATPVSEQYPERREDEHNRHASEPSPSLQS